MIELSFLIFQQIYDCAFEFAVELSNDGFVKCDILAAQHVRQIIGNDSRRRKLVSGPALKMQNF